MNSHEMINRLVNLQNEFGIVDVVIETENSAYTPRFIAAYSKDKILLTKEDGDAVEFYITE